MFRTQGWKIQSPESRTPGLRQLFAASAVLPLIALLPGALSAQEPADTVLLNPIDVSVLRSPIAENSAPFAVSALTEEDMQRGRGGIFLEEALQGLPGVQIQNRFNPAIGERVMIRGFGARAQFGLRDFRIVVDGIPATLPDGQASLDHLDIASLGRVEVLRGPSSALFGNAGGGVLSFTTREASSRPLEIEVDGASGSFGLTRGQLSLSGTSGTTSYLISGYTVSGDGFRTVQESSPRYDTLSAYGGFERMGANARLTRPVLGGTFSITANVLDLGAENPGSIPVVFDPYRGVHDTYLRFRTRKDISQQQAGVQWTGALGESEYNGTFSIYGVRRSVYNPLPFDLVDLNRRAGGARVDLSRSFATGLGAFEVHAGGDLDLQSDTRLEFGNEGGAPPVGEDAALNQDEKVRGIGTFLQGRLNFAGGSTIIAGLRYDNHRFEAVDHIPVSPENPDDSGVRTMDAFSPSIGANIPLTPVINLFGSVSTVFTTPTTSELSNQETSPGGFNPNLDPMTGRSIEVGVRARMGATTTFEVATFQTNLSNELVAFEVEGSPGLSYFRNAGESRHRGVEATVSTGSRNGFFRGDLTYTYTDARFESYMLGGDELGGNRVPGISPRRIQGLFRIHPTLPIGNAFVELVGTAMDDVPTNDRNTASAPAYELVDLRLGVDGVQVGGTTLSPWVAVTNLLDEEYIASVAVNAAGPPNAQRYFEPGPPRAFQVGVRAMWNGGE